MDIRKRIDEYGNIEGYEGSELLAGEMIKDQAIPEGCSQYNDPSNAPVYGSSSTAGLSKVSKKKIKHNFVNSVEKRSRGKSAIS